jgi:hypothetical protein
MWPLTGCHPERVSLTPEDGISPRMTGFVFQDAGNLIAAASCGDSGAGVCLPSLFDAGGKLSDVRQLRCVDSPCRMPKTRLSDAKDFLVRPRLDC